MTIFQDGPAAEQVLLLRRSPVMLRVVQSRNGKWDALDQVEDTASAGEKIYVYRLVAKPTWLHMRCGGKGGKAASGFWPQAAYKLLHPQPGDQHTRDNQAWETWCLANKERLLQEFGPDLQGAT